MNLGMRAPGPSSFYSAARQGPTIMNWLAPPIRARGESESGTWSHSVGRSLGSIKNSVLWW
jgi:hypothetical protein